MSHPLQSRTLQITGPILGGWVKWHSLRLPHLRGAFGDVDIGEDWRALPKSDTPTLVLSGTLDPRTYPESHREAVAGFSDVTQVIVENAGHDLYFEAPQILSLAVIERTLSFLKGEDIDDLRIISPPPDFSPQ